MPGREQGQAAPLRSGRKSGTRRRRRLPAVAMKALVNVGTPAPAHPGVFVSESRVRHNGGVVWQEPYILHQG
jgi:hypothetical protein